MILGLVKALAGPVGTIAEKYFDNKEQKEAFKSAVELEILKNGKALEDAASSIILAEAQSESWITSSWRPILMMVFVSIVAIQLLIVPYLLAPLFWVFGLPSIVTPSVPQEVWTLIQIGIGGYVGGRSIEKATKSVATTLQKRRNLQDY